MPAKLKVYDGSEWVDPDLKVWNGSAWESLRGESGSSTDGWARVLRVVGNNVSEEIVKYNPASDEFPFSEFYSTSGSALDVASMINARINNRVLSLVRDGFRGTPTQPVPSGYSFSGKIILFARLQWDTAPVVGSSEEPVFDPEPDPPPLPETPPLPELPPEPEGGPSGQGGVSGQQDNNPHNIRDLTVVSVGNRAVIRFTFSRPAFVPSVDRFRAEYYFYSDTDPGNNAWIPLGTVGLPLLTQSTREFVLPDLYRDEVLRVRIRSEYSQSSVDMVSDWVVGTFRLFRTAIFPFLPLPPTISNLSVLPSSFSLQANIRFTYGSGGAADRIYYVHLQWRKYTGSPGADSTASWSDMPRFNQTGSSGIRAISTTLSPGESIRVRARVEMNTGRNYGWEYASYTAPIPSISDLGIAFNSALNRPVASLDYAGVRRRGTVEWDYQTYSGSTVPTGSAGSWRGLADSAVGGNRSGTLSRNLPASIVGTGIRVRARIKHPSQGALLRYDGDWLYSDGFTYPVDPETPPPPPPTDPEPVPEVRPELSNIRVLWNVPTSRPQVTLAYATSPGTLLTYLIEIRYRRTNSTGTSALGAWINTDHRPFRTITQSLPEAPQNTYYGVQARVKTAQRTGDDVWTGEWQNADPYPYDYPDPASPPPPPDPPDPPAPPGPVAPTNLQAVFSESGNNIIVEPSATGATKFRTRVRFDGGSWSGFSPRTGYGSGNRTHGKPSGARRMEFEMRAQADNGMTAGPEIFTYDIPQPPTTPPPATPPTNLGATFTERTTNVQVLPTATNAILFRTRARFDGGEWSGYSPSTGYGTGARVHGKPSGARVMEFEVTARSPGGLTAGPQIFSFTLATEDDPEPPPPPPPEDDPEPPPVTTTGNQPQLDVEIDRQVFVLGAISADDWEAYFIDLGSNASEPSSLKFVVYGRESGDPHSDYHDVTMWPTRNRTDTSTEWSSVMVVALYDRS